MFGCVAQSLRRRRTVVQPYSEITLSPHGRTISRQLPRRENIHSSYALASSMACKPVVLLAITSADAEWEVSTREGQALASDEVLAC